MRNTIAARNETFQTEISFGSCCIPCRRIQYEKCACWDFLQFFTRWQFLIILKSLLHLLYVEKLKIVLKSYLFLIIPFFSYLFYIRINFSSLLIKNKFDKFKEIYFGKNYNLTFTLIFDKNIVSRSNCS